jgi:hypothetical protein
MPGIALFSRVSGTVVAVMAGALLIVCGHTTGNPARTGAETQSFRPSALEVWTSCPNHDVMTPPVSRQDLTPNVRSVVGQGASSGAKAHAGP